MADVTLGQDTVLGIFDSRESANNAVEALREKGFQPKDFSIITREQDEVTEGGDSVGDAMAEGAAGGAVTGGALGALAGLLVGVGALALPGIGALFIGGPLAAALGLTGAAATTASGALTGALAGGLVGGLVGLGVPEEEARHYEERIKEGAVLLAVPTVLDGNEVDVAQIMQSSGASQTRLLES